VQYFKQLTANVLGRRFVLYLNTEPSLERLDSDQPELELQELLELLEDIVHGWQTTNEQLCRPVRGSIARLLRVADS
jgi:hypothetical protein